MASAISPEPAPFASERGGEVWISVRASTRSSRPGVGEVGGGALKVRLASPPAEGRANREMMRLVARHLGVPPRSVRLMHGDRSKDKVVAVENVTLDEVVAACRRGGPG